MISSCHFYFLTLSDSSLKVFINSASERAGCLPVRVLTQSKIIVKVNCYISEIYQLVLALKVKWIPIWFNFQAHIELFPDNIIQWQTLFGAF